MFLDDDEYYDDEYYDDDEYVDGEDGEKGGSGIVVILVALIVVLGVGALGAGAWLLLGKDGGDGEAPTDLVEDAQPTPTVAPDPLDTLGDFEADALAADTPEPTPAAEPVADAGSTGDSWEDPPERRLEPVRRDPVYREPIRRATSDEEEGIVIRRTRPAAREDTSYRDPEPRREPVRREPTPEPTPEPEPAGDLQPGQIIDEEPERAQRRPSRREDEPTDENMSYEPDYLNGLESRAVAGALTDAQERFLEAVPDSSPQFTHALSIAMRDAEAKREFKRHCDLINRVVTKPENRYHPEWNLELAKCRLRNSDYEGAVAAVDRTLTDSMGMTSSTKVRRLLLAYEIKAVSRTKLYDLQAEANSGMVDEAMLNNAIAAWTAFRNYASGIGNTKALQKAEREIADLNARKGG